MPKLELSREEAAELHAILKSCLSDLRMEIAGTDSADFREGLKWREMLLDKLVAQLGGPNWATHDGARGSSGPPPRQE